MALLSEAPPLAAAIDTYIAITMWVAAAVMCAAVVALFELRPRRRPKRRRRGRKGP